MNYFDDCIDKYIDDCINNCIDNSYAKREFAYAQILRLDATPLIIKKGEMPLVYDSIFSNSPDIVIQPLPTYTAIYGKAGYLYKLSVTVSAKIPGTTPTLTPLSFGITSGAGRGSFLYSSSAYDKGNYATIAFEFIFNGDGLESRLSPRIINATDSDTIGITAITIVVEKLTSIPVW